MQGGSYRLQGNIFRRLQSRRYTILTTAAVAILVISSIIIIPRTISTYAQNSSGPNAHYIPSSAFGDTDDLPSGATKAARMKLAPGSSSVSGVVTDATTGQPVANATVGISLGQVG